MRASCLRLQVADRLRVRVDVGRAGIHTCVCPSLETRSGVFVSDPGRAEAVARTSARRPIRAAATAPAKSFGRASRATVVVVVALLAMITARPAAAQIAAGPGMTATVPSGDTITCTNCLALSAFGGTITAPGSFTVTVTGNGLNTMGVSATNGGTINLENGGTINATGLAGPGAQAVYAQGAGSTITGINVDINSTGTNSAALQAGGGGVINWTGGTILKTRDTSAGVIVANPGGTVNVTGTTLGSAASPLSQGIEVNGGTVVLNNVTLNYGSTAMGIFSDLTPGGGTVTVNGGSITGVAGGNALIRYPANGAPTTKGAPLTVNVENGAVLTAAPNNPRRVLAVFNGNTVILNVNNATLNGGLYKDAASTSNVSLANGAVWNILSTNDNSIVTSLTNSASTINFAKPTGDPTLQSSYRTVTATTYRGAGGTINMNTFLGTDGSPSNQIVIANGGTASSTTPTNLIFHNTGGPGELTTGNGILVVNAVGTATTAPGTFMLNGELRAGAFDYNLFRGSPSNVNDPNAANDWFLRSTFVQATPPPTTPPPPMLPPAPPPAQLPPGVYPIIGPELATYGVVQPIARQLGQTTLGTLHERVGDAATDTTCPAGATSAGIVAPADGGAAKASSVPDNCRLGIWGRVFGQQIDNRYQAFADPRASGQVAGIQTGVDAWRGSLIPGHSDIAGFYFAYGNGSVSVDGLVTNAAATAYVLERTGSLNLNAYSLGGYWTHYGPAGWYVDAVLQGSFYNGNAATQFANLPINGTGFISSLETGYPIPLPWLGPRFVLEPEGQIIWQQVSLRDGNDGLGPVGLGTTSGASGRLGLRGKWTINDPAGRVWQPYVLANVWRDWGADATTMFGSDPVPVIEQATRLEFAGGLSAKIVPGFSLYIQAGYQFATSGQIRRDGVSGNFSAHYSW